MAKNELAEGIAVDNDKLSGWVTAMISPAQAQRLDELASAARISRSAVIRLLIDHAVIESVASVRFVEAVTHQQPEH